MYADDLASAQVKYVGRENDKIKYEVSIKIDGRATIFAPFVMYTDPGVLNEDAIWQGGLIVENEGDRLICPGNPDVCLVPIIPIGGLARFTTPIIFWQFGITGLTQVYGPNIFSHLSEYGDVFRWDMWSQGKGQKLAATGQLQDLGKFSVTWQNWH